jgi:hypothetical protein
LAAVAIKIVCLFVLVTGSATIGNAEVADISGLSDSSLRALSERGFVAVSGEAPNPAQSYRMLREQGVNPFITADVVLRTTRLFLDEVLLTLEGNELYERLEELSREMVRLSEDQYLRATDSFVREAARLNVAFFSVGLSLLDPEFFPSETALGLVERELALVEEGAVVGFSPIMGATPLDGVAGPGEDYSHYISEGHYASSERLERFHRAVTWYSRMAFALPEGRVEDYRLTIQALLVVRALEEEAGDWLELWSLIYDPLLFFRGGAGDPTVLDYMEIADDVFGEEFNIELLSDQELVARFAERVGEIAPPHFETHELRGLRLLCPRDFHYRQGFRRLGSTSEQAPSVALSLMALLGSRAARSVLDDQDAFGREIYRVGYHELEFELEQATYGDWTSDLYWSWLHAISALFEPSRNQLPDFARTRAWETRMLSTAAAAWADIRRAPAGHMDAAFSLRDALSEVESHCLMVEPYPELYVRLRDLLDNLRDKLWENYLLDDSISARMDAYREFIVSVERSCVAPVGDTTQLGAASDGPMDPASGPGFLGGTGRAEQRGVPTESVAFVASVYHDFGTGTTIEVAVGDPDLIYVSVGQGEDRLLFGGVISSFYEFKTVGEKALTTKDWLRKLDSSPPPRPQWVMEFLQE